MHYQWREIRGQDVDINSGRPCLTLLKRNEYAAGLVGKNWFTGKFYSTVTTIRGYSDDGTELFFNTEKNEFSSFEELAKFIAESGLPPIAEFESYLTVDDCIELTIKTWSTFIKAIPISDLKAIKQVNDRDSFLAKVKYLLRVERIVNWEDLMKWFDQN